MQRVRDQKRKDHAGAYEEYETRICVPDFFLHHVEFANQPDLNSDLNSEAKDQQSAAKHDLEHDAQC